MTSYPGLPGTNGTNNSNPTRPTATLPSSNVAASERDGMLEATILSVYDLPFAEPPAAVSLTACGKTITGNPPIARHKDKNSFRFQNSTLDDTASVTTTNNSKGNGSVKFVAPLKDIYASTVTIRVVYPDKSKLLEAEFDVKELRICESKWLILNLIRQQGGGTPQPTSTATTTSLDDKVPATIRLKLHLSGPYRPEIAALAGIFQAWFGFVDHLESNAYGLWKSIPKPSQDYLSYVSIPIVALLMAVVGFPFLLPIIFLMTGLAVVLLPTGSVLYSSTKHGREHLGRTFSPIVESFVSSRAGQSLIYETGPRPTPVSLAKVVVPRNMWTKFVFSVCVDLLGSATYLVPGIGECLDLIWAPLQTIMVMAMYDPTTPNLKYLSFAEEILPFTDIVPTATIGWACEYVPELFLGMKESGDGDIGNMAVVGASYRTTVPNADVFMRKL